MRVLVGVAPSYGHFLPLLPTVRALVAAGHEVAVATDAGFHPVVEAAGLPALEAGMSDEAMLEQRRQRWPRTEHQPPSEWAVRMFARIAAPAMLAALGPLVRDWRADLVIHDEGEYASPVAAAEAGIPWVTHGWGSPLRLPGGGDLGALETDAEDLWRSRVVPMPPLAGLYHYAVIDPCPASLQPGLSQIPTRVPVRFEPYEPVAAGGLPARLSEPGRPLAYVGFGTTPLYRDAPDLLAAIVDGLVREGYDVLATVGDEPLAERLRRLSPSNVHVERFVSLPAVLAASWLVVCHGGAGTTLAALRAGLPLIIAPRGAPSQARMASACRAAGVAQVLEDGADRDAVGRAVRAAAGDRTRRRAAAIADEMAAMPPASSLVEDLEARWNP